MAEPLDENEIVEIEYSEEYEAHEQPPPDVVVFNELRSCADLYRLVASEQLEIQPYFQREEVWSAPDQTRFIDSLVKQLPIPSLCLGFDYQQRKWMVIDGFQRMTTIVQFLDPKSTWTLSKLKDIDPSLSGVNIAVLRDPKSTLHVHYERVENMTLPITVIRCNFKDAAHTEYLFKIFHRLNAGGMRLSNQEIRNCIYAGPFNRMLRSLDDEDANWNSLKSHIVGKKDRFRSVELILRAFAFHDDRKSYKGNLPKFLNNFMQSHRHAPEAEVSKYRERFTSATKLIVEHVVPLLGDRRLGFAQTEALLVGVLVNLQSLQQKKPEDVRDRVNAFLHLDVLSSAQLKNDLSSRERVSARLEKSIQAFA